MNKGGLDDFFAKKDKKKSKKKFPERADIVVPQESPAPASSNHEEEVETDEWIDFKVEEQKDYSGLKLQQLTIKDADEEENEEHGSDDEGGDYVFSGWNAMTGAGGAAPPPAAAAPEPPAVEQVKEEAKSVYVSPALRNMQSMGQMKAKSGVAPDLSSDSYFPALGQEPPKPPSQSLKPPTDKSGAKAAPPPLRPWRPLTQPPSTVALDNRFGSLNVEES